MSDPVILTGCQLPVFVDETCAGRPVTYYSSQQTVSCPSGYSGGSFTSVLGKFTSQVSQANADAQAAAYLGNLLMGKCIYIPVPVVSSGSVTVAPSGAVNYQIVATNSPTSYGATGLPMGLSINTMTGLITGNVPATAPIVYTIGISATNFNGTGNGTLTITVLPPPPVITSALAENIQDDVLFTYQITATNSPTSFSATGLPSGLAVNTSTGIISGTITGIAEGTVYTIGLSATNAGGTGTSTLTLTVITALGIVFESFDGTGTTVFISLDGGAYAAASVGPTYTALAQLKYKVVVPDGGHGIGQQYFAQLHFTVAKTVNATYNFTGNQSGAAGSPISSATSVISSIENYSSGNITTGTINNTKTDNNVLTDTVTGGHQAVVSFGANGLVAAGIQIETILNFNPPY